MRLMPAAKFCAAVAFSMLIVKAASWAGEPARADPLPSPSVVPSSSIAPGPNPTPSLVPSASPEPSTSASPAASPYARATKSGSIQIRMSGQESEREGAMPYKKFIEGATSQTGLFTVWRKQERVYLEISPQQLDHPYLLVPILASGLGAGLFAGIHFDPIIWKFHRVGDQIFSVEDNPYAKSTAGTAAARVVAAAYPQSVMSADPVLAVNGDDGHIVFPADALLSDIVDLTDAINSGSSELGARYRLDSRLSYYGPSKALPKNVDIESDLTLSSAVPGPIDTVPDSRSLFVKLHYSIVEMPDDGYRPRLADDRLGYFVTARRQYDDYSGPTSFVRYIHRWNIQKSDPHARVSDAKTPIVFYISNDVPRAYRPAIARALLTWNKGFEAIGIRHAIVVRAQPPDPSWDPDDVRYSVVRWVASPAAAFAYAPSCVNPLTGEIFKADVVIDGNIVRAARRPWDSTVVPTRAAGEREMLLKGGNRAGWPAGESWPRSIGSRQLVCSKLDCDYAWQAGVDAQRAVLVLESEGQLPWAASGRDWFTSSFITSLVLHESGHALGLRHNFESSAIYPLAQLRDRHFTDAHGLVGSVMDYTPVNIAPHGQPQGSYFQTRLGPWDYFSIKYGYERLGAGSPEAEAPALGRLAAQATRPELKYATDEDASWSDGFASDPRVNQFDLSADPLAFVRDELTIDQRLFHTLAARVPANGHSFAETRRAFELLLRHSWSSAQLATHYIGGEYFTRNHRGDPNARLPFTPVPRAQERRAFALLDRYAFGEDAFRFSPALINSLGDDRYAHWQSDPNQSTRLDFPLEEYIELYQAALLGQMWQPQVLARLAGMESRVARPGETMSLADLYDWTDASIFGDLRGRRTLTSPAARRSLQHLYAELLVHIMLRPDPGTPTDARSLARHHLSLLTANLDAALAKRNTDEATVANWEDVRALARRALAANVVFPAW